MSTWEERMAGRAHARAAELQEANRREDMAMAAAEGIHLHGTAVACPCGAETGIACVIFEDGWVQPDPCETCGKPAARFCDCRASREVDKHAIGCPERPDTARCKRCGAPYLTGMVSAGGGWVCFPCSASPAGE